MYRYIATFALVDNKEPELWVAAVYFKGFATTRMGNQYLTDDCD